MKQIDPDTAQSPVKPSSVATEPEYYMEHGLLVFTAAYHQRRGYCCKSGCRHCPYGFDKRNDSQKTK
jgi:Family of unknown function (DUF5522)